MPARAPACTCVYIARDKGGKNKGRPAPTRTFQCKKASGFAPPPPPPHRRVYICIRGKAGKGDVSGIEQEEEEEAARARASKGIEAGIGVPLRSRARAPPRFYLFLLLPLSLAPSPFVLLLFPRSRAERRGQPASRASFSSLSRPFSSPSANDSRLFIPSLHRSCARLLCARERRRFAFTFLPSSLSLSLSLLSLSCEREQYIQRRPISLVAGAKTIHSPRRDMPRRRERKRGTEERRQSRGWRSDGEGRDYVFITRRARRTWPDWRERAIAGSAAGKGRVAFPRRVVGRVACGPRGRRVKLDAERWMEESRELSFMC